jgi:hypothetical protein
MRINVMKSFLILTAIVCLTSTSAMAQIGNVGIRAGYTDDDPKQFHAGVHFVTKPFLSALTFRPNLEVGVGIGGKLYAGNLEMAVKYVNYSPTWWGFVGGGPAVNVFRMDEDSLVKTGTRVGINFFIGVENASGFFMESKVGIRESPTYKATVGYTFGRD